MRILVDMLAVGDRLISDAFNSVGLHVCSAGTILDADDIAMLSKHRIDYVDVAARLDISPPVSAIPPKNSQLEQGLAFTKAIDGIKALFEAVDMGSTLKTDDVEAAFNPLIHSFDEEHDVVSLLLSLNSKDDYTYQHSVQVGMLSYYLAKWLGKTEEEALLIGKAGYLHDIGKGKIENSILQKPGRLTDEEFAEIKKHTIYGFEIIRQSYEESAIALAALQHHERLDGKGYPLGKKGPDIHPYAKIVAVADVYSAMICNRSYQKKRDLLVVLKELHRMSFGELDPQATHVFIQNMIPNFIGKKITLTDGRNGLIIMTNPSDYFRPLIKINEQFIDLAHESQIDIDSVTM
jgi:putative nucleotidyltransferase with HDIG domain